MKIQCTNNYKVSNIKNNILKSNKVLLTNDSKKKQDGLDSKNSSTEKKNFPFEKNNFKNDKIKSSLFYKYLNNSKEENKINSCRIKNTLEEISNYYDNESKIKKEILTNFSLSLGTKSNFPDIRSERLDISKNKTILNFFKPREKKNAISLKKEPNMDLINNLNINSNGKPERNKNMIVPLKYPKRPTTMDYGMKFQVNGTTNNKINKNNETSSLKTNHFNSGNNSSIYCSENNFDNSNQIKNNYNWDSVKNIRLNKENNHVSIFNKNSKSRISSFHINEYNKKTIKFIKNDNLHNINMSRADSDNINKLSNPHFSPLSIKKNSKNEFLNDQNFHIILNQDIELPNQCNLISLNSNNPNYNHKNPNIEINRIDYPDQINNYFTKDKFQNHQTKQNLLHSPQTGNFPSCLNLHNINSLIKTPTNITLLPQSPNKRPKTVGLSDFKINKNINQDTYKSVIDVMGMTTTYFPFSKKRDKLSELEKQSYLFHNHVEKEMRDAKRKGARKIKIKSKNELASYLIRDYFIGEKNDPISSSKKRMKLTKDYDIDKEIQKKKKMAMLKNEEYKETDKEELSDSDERIMFETNEEEEKIKANKDFSSVKIIEFENKSHFDQKSNINNLKKYKNEDEYFSYELNSKLNTESNVNRSVSFKEENLEVYHDYQSSSETDKNIKIEEYPKLNLKQMEKKIEIISNYKVDEESEYKTISTSPYRRNNLANKANIKNTINRKNESSNNSNIVEDKKKKTYSQNADEINSEENLIDNKNLKKQMLKKIDFIKKLPVEKIQQLIDTKKKKFEEKFQEEINIRSENKANQILDISLKDYDEINQEIDDSGNEKNINLENLNRVIRVRNILKGKFKEDENHRTDFKSMQKEDEEEINKIIRFRKLGPPSFLKTNFKKETNLKFKMLGGKFFGCKV